MTTIDDDDDHDERTDEETEVAQAGTGEGIALNGDPLLDALRRKLAPRPPAEVDQAGRPSNREAAQALREAFVEADEPPEPPRMITRNVVSGERAARDQWGKEIREDHGYGRVVREPTYEPRRFPNPEYVRYHNNRRN